MLTFTYAAFIQILVTLFLIGLAIGFWWMINYDGKK